MTTEEFGPSQIPGSAAGIVSHGADRSFSGNREAGNPSGNSKA